MGNIYEKPDLSLPEEMEFNLSDFALFLSVMKNREAYESTLSIITDNPDLSLTEVHVEEVVLNRSGKRAIRLDAWAMDSENRQYNAEMQNDTDHDDIRKRARFYQGLLDTPVLKSGKKTRYRQLPSTMIIFITQEDIFRRGLAQYTFTEQCEEVAGLHLEDGTTKVFLNMASTNGRPELVSLLQYMKESRLDNPNILVKDRRILKLAEIVEEVKQSEEWEAVKMSILSVGISKGEEYGIKIGMEKGLAEGMEKGLAEGMEKGLAEGMERGLAEGMEKGLAQGMVQGVADSILSFLEELGLVPDSIREQILGQQDLDVLNRWMKLAARSESIEKFVEETGLNG